jgi:two-component system sensor histidine kinase MprB
VAQVAEETGGSIRLEPAPGGGTLARLRLPGSTTAPRTPPDPSEPTA